MQTNFIFTVDKNRRILDPCHPAVARKLTDGQKARELRRYPEVIILDKDVLDANAQPLTLKIDPGSKVTGFALLNSKHEVIWAMELTHRGKQIMGSLTSRRAVRRNRRSRKTRYRKARFKFRTKPKGWLAPSLVHRVLTIETWVKRICRYAKVTHIVMELVCFDTQLIQNPEISGIDYQQGTLYGYEVRQYLLAKWGRKCAYCSAEDVPLQIDHIQPKSKGGSNRVSNLTLACESCNLKKGNQDIRVFLAGRPDVLSCILNQSKAPLKDAAAVNSTRWKLFNQLKLTGLPVSIGTGGQTQYNRTVNKLSKSHWIDAACVGKDTGQIILKTAQPLKVKCKGHGNRQMCGTDKYGFPNRHRRRRRRSLGFQTGDIVCALIPKGKYEGRWIGRVSIRSKPCFTLSSSVVFDVHPKYLKTIHRSDGYNYTF